MPDVLHLTPADARRRPWKNGRGATDELALWPADASFERGTFDWRVSRTRVGASGPFSSFPGFERVLVVTGGSGLVLEHGEHAPRSRLRPLEPYRFRGDWPTTAELCAGPVDDLGVLARLGTVEPAVEALRLGRRRAREVLERGHALAHVLDGAVSARVTGEDEAFDLEPGDSLWVRDLRGGEEIDLWGREEGSVVLLVRLGPPTS